MNLNPLRHVAGALGLLLLVAVGCSQSPRTPYGHYLDARARHDAAVELIEAYGGHVRYEDPGTAATLVLSDKPGTRKAMAAVGDLMQPDSVTLIKTGVTDWELEYLGELPTLRVLTIRDARLTQSGVNYLEDRPNLTELHLFNTGLDDYRLTNIINKLPQLQALTVAYDPVTNTSVRRLGRLKNLRRLTLLDTDADFESVAGLIESHPRLILRFNDKTIKGPAAGE